MTFSGCWIDLHLHEYKIEIYENRHSDRNIDCKIKIEKEIEQELGFKFVRMDPDKEDFDSFRIISEAFRHIKQSTRKH